MELRHNMKKTELAQINDTKRFTKNFENWLNFARKMEIYFQNKSFRPTLFSKTCYFIFSGRLSFQ